ncbi:hypothetical protein GCM10011366_05400 [Ornithinimicrobium tianjinense]|uniref:Uncharacterized protein n=1 Tax=Ornithinimicrobium tianjinense TaxID=1195761 RepID=A0A917F221_9MICO|nr:hypothetical protein GCM10011366_05400 [Ornithinimicrobium tianjinense]
MRSVIPEVASATTGPNHPAAREPLAGVCPCGEVLVLTVMPVPFALSSDRSAAACGLGRELVLPRYGVRHPLT